MHGILYIKIIVRRQRTIGSAAGSASQRAILRQRALNAAQKKHTLRRLTAVRNRTIIPWYAFMEGGGIVEISANMRRYNHLLQETDAVYRGMALHWGLPDSVLCVLYALCETGGRCRPFELCRRSSMSKQTVNSALRRMERDGYIYLEPAGRGKLVCLTPAGEVLAAATARRLIQAENDIFDSWTQEDVTQYLSLTERFAAAIAAKAREIREDDHEKNSDSII